MAGLSIFCCFGRSGRRRGSEQETEYVTKGYYKVYPGDEDRGRWVGEPGIDRKASAYISLTTGKWEKIEN